ncbi:MAG: response regulator transcription factor [Acidobacteriota bacterium]
MNDDCIRVALVDDDRLLRDSLRRLIDGAPGFRCGGDYGTVGAAAEGLAARPADVVLLDVDLPATPGPEGVAVLRALEPCPEIVMYTVYADDERVFTSLCNGACGYLLKDTPPHRLLEALREARDGGAPMTSRIARRVVELFRRVAPPAPAHHDLTPQELRLLDHFAEGYSYQASAERLGISINTVRSHVRSVYEKLHVHSRSQALHQARKRGILR